MKFIGAAVAVVLAFAIGPVPRGDAAPAGSAEVASRSASAKADGPVALRDLSVFEGLLCPGLRPVRGEGAATTVTAPGREVSTGQFVSGDAPASLVDHYRRTRPGAKFISVGGTTLVSDRIFGGTCVAITIAPAEGGGSRVSVSMTDRECGRTAPMGT